MHPALQAVWWILGVVLFLGGLGIASQEGPDGLLISLAGIFLPWVLEAICILRLPVGLAYLGYRGITGFFFAQSEEGRLQKRLKKLEEEEKLLDLRRKVEAKEEKLWKRLESN